MTKKQKYIAAAKLLYEDNPFKRCNFCCVALIRVKQSQEKFEAVFQLANSPIVWWGTALKDENRTSRSLALLLMAEMEDS